MGNTCGPQPDLSGSNRQLRSVAQLRLSQPGFQHGGPVSLLDATGRGLRQRFFLMGALYAGRAGLSMCIFLKIQRTDVLILGGLFSPFSSIRNRAILDKNPLVRKAKADGECGVLEWNG